MHGALLDWLHEWQRIWPRTPNRHVLVSAVTATGTAPVSDYYLSWHLLLRGVQREQIRGDRVPHEALAVRADRCTWRRCSTSAPPSRSIVGCKISAPTPSARAAFTYASASRIAAAPNG